jgi:SAM-dependent methyltransferase
MVRQRPLNAAPAVRAVAEALPFQDNAFGAGLAILTIHHWQSWKEGLRELTRVVRERVVVLTWDPESEGFWLVQDYFPEFIEADRKRLPAMAALRPFFTQLEIHPLPIPHDCCDGFLGAYWRRPTEYLRQEVRGGISSFATLSEPAALKRLADDLESGRWQQLYGEVLAKEELDMGYRLLVGRPKTR